jgi:hypothetical protein
MLLSRWEFRSITAKEHVALRKLFFALQGHMFLISRTKFPFRQWSICLLCKFVCSTFSYVWRHNEHPLPLPRCAACRLLGIKICRNLHSSQSRRLTLIRLARRFPTKNIPTSHKKISVDLVSLRIGVLTIEKTTVTGRPRLLPHLTRTQKRVFSHCSRKKRAPGPVTEPAT